MQSLVEARALLPSWLDRLDKAQARMTRRHVGAIPPYSAFFRREKAPWEAGWSGTQYVLKFDGNYMIQSDSSSETWWLFCEGNRFAQRGRFIDAMLLMLTVVGIMEVGS